MKSFKYIKSIALIIFCTITLTTSSACLNSATAQPVQIPVATVKTDIKTDAALDIVNNPSIYLNKVVTIQARFDKFSTLGLDYKPAFKSSDEYISFLIKRDDTTFDIPLSEMKLFLKRETAENFIELKTDDIISITGTVFSDALGDAWIDVLDLYIVKKAPDKNGVK